MLWFDGGEDRGGRQIYILGRAWVVGGRIAAEEGMDEGGFGRGERGDDRGRG